MSVESQKVVWNRKNYRYFTYKELDISQKILISSNNLINSHLLSFIVCIFTGATCIKSPLSTRQRAHTQVFRVSGAKSRQHYSAGMAKWMVKYCKNVNNLTNMAIASAALLWWTRILIHWSEAAAPTNKHDEAKRSTKSRIYMSICIFTHVNTRVRKWGKSWN